MNSGSGSAPAHLRNQSLRSETAPHRIFGNRAWYHKLKQIIRPARFGTDARKLEATKRLPIDERSRDLAIDVEITNAELLFDSSNILRATRIEAAGQRVGRAVGNFQSVAQIPGPEDGQDWTENLFLR